MDEAEVGFCHRRPASRVAACAGSVRGRQRAFDLPAVRLEERREHELLAQMRGIFVNREAGAFGCQLEQHAARFSEIDGLEPETIDHRRRLTARALDLLAHGELLVLVGNAPRQVMNAADAPRAAPRVWRFADVHDAGRLFEAVARPAVLAREPREPQNARQKVRRLRSLALPDLRAEEATYLTLLRNRAGVPRRERAAGRPLDERKLEAVRIRQRQDAIAEPRFRFRRCSRRTAAGAIPSTSRLPAGTSSPTSVARP